MICIHSAVQAVACKCRLWHSKSMKALMSKLAAEVLADPAASVQLRQFLVNKRVTPGPKQRDAIGQLQVRRGNEVVNIEATVVPTAPKSA